LAARVPPPNPLVNNPPEWLSEGAAQLWLPYAQMQTTPMSLPVQHTEGVHIHLTDGRQLIDATSSWWTAAHGYNHPHIAEAVARQLELMPHVMLGGLAHEPAATLATRLANLLPGDLNHVFFSESGSVAVEIAMKMAVQYWINRGVHGRTRFVCFRGGYHGDTLGAMSICDPDDGMHSLFKGALLPQILADLPQTEESEKQFDALVARHAHEAAAIIVEPLVQGAGGMLMHDARTLQRLAAACKKHNLLLIFDEIFTGFGRSGQMFACLEARVTPDIITLSKALTGGTMALAATVAQTHVFDAFLSEDFAAALMHGPTYMGNPLACAAANASLDLFEREPRLKQVARIESLLAKNLEPARALPNVRDVRVKGAIGVIELHEAPDLTHMKRRFVEEGIWLRPFGRFVYTTPPFVMADAELAQVTEAMLKVVTEAAQLTG
jgi:adenosylmethionine-8-amino-7-oxononanoate aminotransferase